MKSMEADMADLERGEEQQQSGQSGNKGTDWKAELKSISILILAVLGFHSLVAKPFYIPSESMMPRLLVGDRLVVTKYPYGWSYVSPSFHLLPFIHGRLMGKLPERGDIVIVTPRGKRSDYIKRVIGLPGDLLEIRDGQVILNGMPVRQDTQPNLRLPIDANAPCEAGQFPGRQTLGMEGQPFCDLPVKRETLPNGRYYDVIDLGDRGPLDWFGPIKVPAGHLFLMGDNRDRSADSRVSLEEGGLGGPVPVETIGGRAEFISFSLDGTAGWNPLSWLSALRGGRAGTSLHPATAAKDKTR